MANEQVGNDSWQTMTPGSAVAGQLQEILTTKRLEARQAMLDNLNAQNVQSQIADRDKQAAVNEEYRKGLIDSRKTQELQRITSTLSPHLPFNDKTGVNYQFLKTNAPELIDPGVEATQPLGPDEAGPSRPAVPESFHGTPLQLKTEHQEKLQGDLQRLMGDPTRWDPMPDAQKEALYRGAYNATIPENVLRPKVGGKVYVIDDATGRLKDPSNGQEVNVNSVGPNDKIINIPRPAAGAQGPGSTPFQAVDENGIESSVGYNPRTNSYEPSKIPQGLRIVTGSRGNAAQKAAPKPPKVNQQTWALWSQAADKVLKGNSAVEGDLNSQAAKIAQELGIPTDVSAPVLDVFRHPENRGRNPQFQPIEGGTSAHTQQAQELWNLLTGGFKGQPQ